MRHAKAIILIVVILVLFQGNLFSLITSRVEGTVIDADNGGGINDAEVSLYLTDVNNNFFKLFQFHTKTDKKGNFSFDLKNLVRPGVGLYVQCKKNGYVAFIPEYYFTHTRDQDYSSMLKIFFMQEGQVKHLKIKLSKGGVLKGKFFKKDVSGISSFGFISASLKRKTNPNEYYLKDSKSGYTVAPIQGNEDGEFELTGIEPYDNYYIVVSHDGYVGQVIEGVGVKLNEDKTIENTIDISDQTGIRGSIKIGNEIPNSGDVLIIRIMDDKPLGFKDICHSSVDEFGNYSCKGLNAGIYRMTISSWDENGEVKKELIIQIKSAELKTLNIEF